MRVPILPQGLRDDRKVEGDALHCRVVSCTDARLVLNVDGEALARIGFKDGGALELRIGKERRKVFDRKYMPWRDWSDLIARETRDAPAGHRARIAAIEKILFDDAGNINSSIDGWEDLSRERRGLKYHPDDLARPPLALDFQKNPDDGTWSPLVCTSAFAETHYDPHTIHVAAAAGASAVLRLI